MANFSGVWVDKEKNNLFVSKMYFLLGLMYIPPSEWLKENTENHQGNLGRCTLPAEAEAEAEAEVEAKAEAEAGCQCSPRPDAA